MVSITSSNISISERSYYDFNTITWLDSNTGSVSINIFEYDHPNYKALNLFFSTSSISSFNTSIGLNDISFWSLSSCSSENSSLNSINLRTTANSNNFFFYERIKLKKNKTYQLSYNVSTIGGSVTANGTNGIQIFNSGTYGTYYSETFNQLVTSSGLKYTGTPFTPTADSYYRIMLRSASGTGNYIEYSNISINILNDSENLLYINNYTPLQVLTIKPSRQLYQDVLKNTIITFPSIEYKSTEIEDESLLEENNQLLFNNTNQQVGHIITPYGLIIINDYNAKIKNETYKLTTNYYNGICWSGTNTSTSASISGLSISSEKNNYVLTIKAEIDDINYNFTPNKTNIKPTGELYNSDRFFSGFKILDDSLSSLLIGKISIPVKKTTQTGIDIILKAEN